MTVRTSTKAIIIEDGKILCSQFKSDRTGKIYYGLPGGGQDHEENLKQAMKRECYEEILAEVEVGDIVFVRDFIRQNHIEEPDDDHFHQVDFYFICKLLNPDGLGVGPVPDSKQIGVEWLTISELSADFFFPAALIPYLKDNQLVGGPVYLGDVA
ncbi:MAG: NUDIX domain-containing protein [Bacteroidota bacterium]